MLIAKPTMEETKASVFGIDPTSAAGPDGLNALFYQKCWSIIVADVRNAVTTFFSGANIPRFFSHTCLVMLPNVEFPQQLSDLSSISLCNVSSKIFSKILNARLALVLPKIISMNQSGFIRGREISENIMLAQEIINDFDKEQKCENLVMKLDMAKAYDRVAWPFLCQVMRILGFSETWILMVLCHISCNWYSIIVNGQRHGFFQSTNGLRQGDPISPSLFVISAELLSTMLNKLLTKRGFACFTMHKDL